MTDPTPGRARGPLDGFVVVDLTRALAGPHAGMILGDLGARVIKVEAPGRGDDTRGWGPPFVGSGPNPESSYFLSCNRNKESIALDLKHEGDRATLRAMLETADVLLENFRPGVMDKLGYGSEALAAINPRLVTLSISGFGHDGPEGARAGYDQIAQGEAGIMSLTGPSPDDPQRVGVPIGDLLAGIYGVVGVLAALLERSATDTGSTVRTSLLAALVGVHAFEGTRWTVAKQVGAAAGNHHPSIAPYGLFRCLGGSVQIAVGSQSLWERFSAGFGIDADDPRFASNGDRVGNRVDLIETIETAFAPFGAPELLTRLELLGIPSGRVRSIDEVYEWDQTRSQGLVVGVNHSTLGEIELPGPTLRFFDRTGAEKTKAGHLAPPTLDEHGSALREEFGAGA
jgi:crotonobetainyl-CoA:carnitine CoA-transferase CaiB-like acyl-CoA transferase